MKKAQFQFFLCDFAHQPANIFFSLLWFQIYKWYKVATYMTHSNEKKINLNKVIFILMYKSQLLISYIFS